MSKIVKLRKDKDTPFDSKVLFCQILMNNGPEGLTIRDMVLRVELKEKIERCEEVEFTFSDSEYDLIKDLYEKNKFPINTRFFLDVYKDINEYTRPSDAKS